MDTNTRRALHRSQVIDLTTTGVAAGGAAVGRDGDGRVVFVRGALPGERVRADQPLAWVRVVA